jgi:SAM-dependent methyltransferase
MNYNPPCPACGAHKWEDLGRQTFARSSSGASAYLAKRLEILFELWVPGRDNLTISHQMCTVCGLVIFKPRPTLEEVASKYGVLGGATSSTVEEPIVTATDRIRSGEFYEALRPWLPAENATLLDHGGGTGGLMVRFLESGAICYLVDYAPQAVPGVKLLGQTLDDLPLDLSFDAIISSHVFEHLVNPREVAEHLAGRLTERGALFIEVPFELFGSPRHIREPVTHLNFFSVQSLAGLLQRAGLQVQRCWTEVTTHASGGYALAIRAIATKSGDAGFAFAGAAHEVRALTSRPAALAKLALAVSFPKLLLNLFKAKKLKRMIGK